jgi:hypothetical protein
MIVSTFIVQASFTIVTYDRQNMFIIQATDFLSQGPVDIGQSHEIHKHFKFFENGQTH